MSIGRDPAVGVTLEIAPIAAIIAEVARGRGFILAGTVTSDSDA